MTQDFQVQLMEQKMKVDFNSYDLSIRELLGMVNDGLLDIAPDYQRKFRWDIERQSCLIESLLLGIPVPAIFVATNADGTWELIDGVQRISSVISFAGNEKLREKVLPNNKTALELKGLTKLTTFCNMTFERLPVDIQNKFKLASIKVTSLTDKSDKNVRFDLFERLNKGGVTLSDQEIRSCVYRGRFNEFIQELSRNEDFIHCVHISKSQEVNGTREELVLRFFAYLYNLDGFSHSVKEFLNQYMESATKQFNYRKAESTFKFVFSKLKEALPKGITAGRSNTPLNLYEAVAVGAALAYEEEHTINVEGIEDWIKDSELMKFISGATNTKSRVNGRIDFCRMKFKK